MSRKRRNRPFDPVEAERHRAEREAANAEAARLEAQGDVVIRRAERTRNITGAQRMDVFALLFSRRALSQAAHDVFRDHEETAHTAAGYATPDRRPDHIRSGTAGAPGQNITTAMVEASRLERMTLDRLSPGEARLLTGLMALGAASLGRWHHTVQTITGETHDQGHAARIRALGDNLIHARSLAHREWKRMQKANDDTLLPDAPNYGTHR